MINFSSETMNHFNQITFVALTPSRSHTRVSMRRLLVLIHPVCSIDLINFPSWIEREGDPVLHPTLGLYSSLSAFIFQKSTSPPKRHNHLVAACAGMWSRMRNARLLWE